MKNKDNRYLLGFRKNVYSQNGEDGVLLKIFSLLPKSKTSWAVEFGAWDGVLFSNTCNFIKHHHWYGAYIEADKERFKELVKNHGENANVYCIHKFIKLKGDDRIDRILQGIRGLPYDFDLLSIDIDSCDYHIWKSIKQYKPKVVIIEFNPSIPLDYNYVQPPDFSIHEESNLGILTTLGTQKGYELICCVENNAIFVRREYYPLFHIKDNSPEVLFAPFKDKYQTQIWQGYDGTLHLLGCKHLLVHNITINEDKIQMLPRFLRFFPGKTHPLLQYFKKLYYKYPIIPRIMDIVLSGTFNSPSIGKDVL